MSETSLLLILFLSFITALTGAMSPGPLLTYTVIKSIKTKKRGYLMGLWIIVGHALLELAIIFLLLQGFNLILQQRNVVFTIGTFGSMLLILMGISMLRNISKGTIPVDFLPNEKIDEDPTLEYIEEKESKKLIKNPIFGGIAVSASNPYWWVWWATIGFAFIIQYDISLRNWSILFFFIGHELGDLIWYFFVSSMVDLGKNHINKKIYYGILAFCSLFMIGFGIYLFQSLF